MADHHLLVLQPKPKSYLPLSYLLLLLLLHPLPIVSYFSVPDLSLDNVNTAIQLTQILYKASSPYAENLQWGSFYDETFWESESSDEEYNEEADGWEWMSDFSVDTWLPNWSAEEDAFVVSPSSPSLSSPSSPLSGRQRKMFSQQRQTLLEKPAGKATFGGTTGEQII